MIKIEELTSEDVVKYQPVFQVCYDLFKDVDGVYYKLNIDGMERILHRLDHLFTIFELDEENTVSYEMFTVDDEYRLSDVAFDEYEMHPVNDYKVFQRRSDGLSEYIDFLDRTNGPDNEGYDANVCHIQYNPNNDMRVMTFYQHNKHPNGRIYPFHLKTPFQIRIEKKTNFRQTYFPLPFCKKTYIKRTFDYRDEPLLYTIVVAKDYGTGALFSNDPVSIHGSVDITRYYKELFISRDYQAVTAFPFCRQYKLEDFNEYLIKHGFNTSIPQLLIDYYNGDIDYVNLYQEIALYMKELDENKDYSEGKPVVLKFKFSGEEVQDGEDS